MKTEMTKLELYNEVQKNYKGVLTLDKALALFDLENGYKPDIITLGRHPFHIDDATIAMLSDKYEADFRSEHFEFMKDIQDSGVCNMVVGDIRNRIQNYFLCDNVEPSKIHSAYMNEYELLYFPENVV